MRFGGHETFPVRDGWLAKGLRLLQQNPEALDRAEVADLLGVGRNMAKSIRHWLQVTGLSARPSRKEPFQPTALADVIWARDRFMLEPVTWWALHANLSIREDTAVTWTWFFGAFANDRFDRMTCVDQLARHVAAHERRAPSRNTLNRDVLCLLSTYAHPVPPAADDPEDGRDSPFRELGLVTHFTETDTYQINRRSKPIPPAALAYALALSHGTQDSLGAEEPLSAALARPGGPGRVFALDGDSLTELVDQAETSLGGSLTTKLLGHERWVQIDGRAPHSWLEDHFRMGIAA
jgi:hypothetical protein